MGESLNRICPGLGSLQINLTEEDVFFNVEKIFECLISYLYYHSTYLRGVLASTKTSVSFGKTITIKTY